MQRACSAPTTSTRCCRRRSARAAATAAAARTPRRSWPAPPTSISARRAAPPPSPHSRSCSGATPLPLNPAQRHRGTAARRADRRGGLHRLRQVPATVPGGCDPRGAQAHAHGARWRCAPAASCASRPARSTASAWCREPRWRTRRPHPARRRIARASRRAMRASGSRRQPRDAFARAQEECTGGYRPLKPRGPPGATSGGAFAIGVVPAACHEGAARAS